MANEQNLLKGDEVHKFTPEEASKGGKKSAEARRKRRTLREELLILLSDPDVQKNMSVALIREATEGNKAGSVTKAFEVIRDTVGEKPIDKMMISEVEPSVISEVENMVLGEDNADKGTST